MKDGTGLLCNFKSYKMAIAGKTGTSTKSNDLWFIGFTPYYTCGVWTGFDNNFSQINTRYQKDIWKTVMENIHSTLQLPYAEFEKPDSIVSARVCSKCGKLAIDGLCDEYVGGNCIIEEYFAKGTVPTEKCDCHVRVRICTESGHLASPECPTSSIVEKVCLKKEEKIYIDIKALQKEAAKQGVAFIGYELPVEEGKEPADPVRIKTWDTPYLVPYDKNAEPCPIHNPGYYEQKENEEPSSDLPDDDDI